MDALAAQPTSAAVNGPHSLSAKGRLRISINFGVSTAFVFIIVLTTIALCAFIFLTLRGILREELRKQIYDTVRVGALLVDGDLHRTLHSQEQEGGSDYLAIKEQLQSIRGRAADVYYVYTMRLNADGEAEFVVDAEEDPEEMSSIGEIYEDVTPTLAEALRSAEPGATFVEREPSIDEWGTWLSGFTVLGDSNGNAAGVLGVDISAATIQEYENQSLLTLVSVAGGVSLVVFVLGVFMSRRITGPLRSLEADMVRIQRFQIDERVPVKSVFTEILRMSEAIWDMKNSLRAFKRYVPADLVAELITTHKEATLGGSRRDLTVFFSDIEGFTTWSEQLSPEQLIHLMARYFSGMTEIIDRNKGTVDKYIGDAIMAFWGAPSELEAHAVHACRAALECGEFQAGFNAELVAEGYLPINTRIGINTGEVLVGNVGYDKRLNYTVIGDHVNLASRLEGLNKLYGTRIIISDHTKDRLGKAFLTRPLDCVVVKGKTEQINVHELMAHNDAPEHLVRAAGHAQRAFDRYRLRDWKGAEAEFDAILKILPTDQAAAVLIQRCRQYIQSEPGPEWKGAVILREK